VYYVFTVCILCKDCMNTKGVFFRNLFLTVNINCTLNDCKFLQICTSNLKFDQLFNILIYMKIRVKQIEILIDEL
jgi:hypothetical protein